MICLLFAPLALLGHVALWITFWNRIQGTGMPLWVIDGLSKAAKFILVVVPFLIWAVLVSSGAGSAARFLTISYYSLCCLIGLMGVPWVWYRRRCRRQCSRVRAIRSVVRCLVEPRRRSLQTRSLGSRILFAVPGNQSFELEENEKELELTRLDPALDGLSIVHLSDFHFTGRVSRSFFDEVVDRVNEMDADLVAVTGDLVDNMRFSSWIPETLGRLQPRHGVYAVLGNHDYKHNLGHLRMLLAEVGVTYLGGRLRELEIEGKTVVLAANELPWIAPTSDMAMCPRRAEQDHLRILLAHTPDALPWARCHDIDLMLAGHTHGGQFCLPGFGPVVCPTQLPLEFATGTIFEEPTLLHVSRGLSGEIPLRLNCRPELTRLVLRCPVSMRLRRQGRICEARGSGLGEETEQTTPGASFAYSEL